MPLTAQNVLLLDCFIPPCSERDFIHHFHLSECLVLLFVTGTLLSKASHSDELVTRINHTDINCDIFTSISIRTIPNYVVTRSEKTLRFLIKRIGDYLTRVVSSVPIDLKITLRVYDGKNSPAVTLGPLYYEGQGQAMSVIV